MAWNQDRNQNRGDNNSGAWNQGGGNRDNNRGNK